MTAIGTKDGFCNNMAASCNDHSKRSSNKWLATFSLVPNRKLNPESCKSNTTQLSTDSI